MALTQSELEARLLAAANSLRGPVDPADFKAYIFPLLFLKRLSDHWDAEHAQGLLDWPSGVPAEAYGDYHRFEIPEGCHWTDLRKATENVGRALQIILDRIQEANAATLAGIFGVVDWANKERLPEHALIRLFDIFDGIPLNPSVVSHDMLGDAYEYLLREFAEASGKKAGEFFTPRAVVRLLAQLLDPRPRESVYDPACGSGGMLVEAVNEVRDNGGEWHSLKLFAQEVNLTTAAIARMNLYIHDIEGAKVLRGDTLREPKFKDAEGALQRFDVVIANPPFILKNWGAEVWAQDAHGRAFCGVPPAGNADWAWIQHMIKSMAPTTGRVGVVMPHGALFRPDKEAKIRACVAGGGLLDAVIGLPPGLFYSTSIRACLLLFRQQKTDDGVLFADGSRRFVKDRARNVMEAADVEAVRAAVRKRQTGEHDGVFTRLVTPEELAAHDHDLRLNHYLQSAAEDGVGFATALDIAYTAHAAYLAAADDFDMRRRLIVGD